MMSIDDAENEVESENENANGLFSLIFLTLCLVNGNESENVKENDLF